jgi:hypothetical protein
LTSLARKPHLPIWLPIARALSLITGKCARARRSASVVRGNCRTLMSQFFAGPIRSEAPSILLRSPRFIPVSRLRDLVGAPWRESFAKDDGHSFGAYFPTSYVTLRNVALAHCRARRWSSFSLLWHSPIDPTLLTGSENLAVLSPSCATVSLVTPQAYKTSCRFSFHSVQIEHRSIVLPHIETMDIDESGPHFRIFLNCWWKHATGLR